MNDSNGNIGITLVSFLKLGKGAIEVSRYSLHPKLIVRVSNLGKIKAR